MLKKRGHPVNEIFCTDSWWFAPGVDVSWWSSCITCCSVTIHCSKYTTVEVLGVFTSDSNPQQQTSLKLERPAFLPCPLVFFLFNWLNFRRLFQVRPGPKRPPQENLWELLKEKFLRARCWNVAQPVVSKHSKIPAFVLCLQKMAQFLSQYEPLVREGSLDDLSVAWRANCTPCNYRWYTMLAAKLVSSKFSSKSIYLFTIYLFKMKSYTKYKKIYA